MKSKISIKINMRKVRKKVLRPLNASLITRPRMKIRIINDNPNRRYLVAKNALAVPYKIDAIMIEVSPNVSVNRFLGSVNIFE